MGMLVNRRRVMGGKSGLLPSGYTQLEYINTSTGAYIDTGVTCNNTDGYFRMSYRPHQKQVLGICGQGRAINQGSSFGVFYSASPFNMGLQYNQPQTPVTTIPLVIDVWHTIEFVDGSFVYDGDAIFSTTDSLSGLWNTFRFGNRQYNAPNTDLGECELLDTHHLIPALRNVDNVAGMYNLITKEFMESASTVPFIAGTPV